ncbi:MAG TPA: glycosyltransferase [Candidatus Baltobacteraceae bacterium]|nr:glycosyltransferase [Candidatus Baltobacteraceae bacterium]
MLHILPSIRGYGAERQIVELLTRLSSAEIDAALLTIYAPPEQACDAFAFPVFHAGRKNRRDFLFIGRLVGEIRRFKPDIVHTHTHVGRYWGRFAALLAGARIVHTEHNPCDFRRTRLERVADWLLHRVTAKVVTFFPEQGRSLSDFDHFPFEKLAIIPNGLALPDSRSANRTESRKLLAVPDDRFAIMVIGRMEYQKNHILALRAVAALPDEVRNAIVIYFAGSGEDETLLRGLARALDLDGAVRFLGYRSDVPKLLDGADLLLMTSWFEGMPLTLLEAMIAGVPIVSTPWTGARNMLGDGRFGFLTADYDASRVAAAIERALKHPMARRAVAEHAQEHIYAEYGIGRMVDAHRKLYLQVGSAS